MKKQQGTSTVTALIGLVLLIAAVIAAGVGYVLNIVKLFHITDLGSHAGEFIIRVVGVLTGIVGAVVGYM
jgi:hypothetical protein